MEKIKEIQVGKNDPYHGIKFAIKYPWLTEFPQGNAISKQDHSKTQINGVRGKSELDMSTTNCYTMGSIALAMSCKFAIDLA